MRESDKATAVPIDLSHLKGLEVQKLVFRRLVDRVFEDPRMLKVTDHETGEVDYIVSEDSGRGILATNRFHYFECKHYSRSLELDNVAKIMVVAVSDQPLSVNVISSTPLQPQVRKYASRLFTFDGSVNPIFRSIEFRHWQTGLFLSDDELNNDPSIKTTVMPLTPEHGLHTIHWWLSECIAFSQTEVASSGTARRGLHVRQGVLLTLAVESADVDSVAISLDGLPQDSWQYVPLAGDVGKGHFLIDTTHLAVGQDYRISLQTAHKKNRHITPLVSLVISGAVSFLPELRANEIDDLQKKMGDTGDVRLSLVDGEAGVGKTHLIEKVAEGLRTKAGYDVLRFTVPETPDDDLMVSVIRNCLAPPIGKGTFSELVGKIEAGLLKQEGDGSLRTDFRLLVRVISGMGPKVIVLRDCHLVTPKLADEIWVLISVLDDSSWGGIRLILEYRQPDALSNAALQGLLRKIDLNIRKILQKKLVAPLDRNSFYRFSKTIFAHITDELITCLFDRTGGFPLFFDSYLRRLQTLGLVKRGDDSHLFEISEPARILTDRLHGGRQVILEERIKTGLLGAFSSDWEEWAIVLGLIATADNVYDQSLILNALDISDRDLRAFREMLSETGIGSVLFDGQIVFRHDLLREAAAAVATAAKGFESQARKVVGALFVGDSKSDEVKVFAIRANIFTLLSDNVACEIELRQGLKAAKAIEDYGRIVFFLNRLLPLLKDRPDANERLDLLTQLCWASWVTESLVVTRERYLQVAAEAERNTRDFEFNEAIATNAYRRAIGLDLELMEPYIFIENTISVLSRRQTHLTFNSILNRLVLFCARFGLPEYGYKFARLSFNYIGDGQRDNEGSVLFSELGMLHAASSPTIALDLFKLASSIAKGRPEEIGTALAVHVHACLYHGTALDIAHFDAIWADCTKHRLTEPLARASLLRGSLFLREGNLKSAGHWIERTATMVQLYHMKQFEIAILNDQILFALLVDDIASAKNVFSKLIFEFERVEMEASRAISKIDKVFQAAERAALPLGLEPSDIERPAAPPMHCDPANEIRQNIAIFASLIGLHEIAKTYTTALLNRPCPEVIGHRCVEISGKRLILGAY
ncbi:hypothetical protein ACO0LO_28860 [Undibacterium sp. TJN25]|uniref:hypothetical protein n=1 Tax=Undibacterium sp. TJN25 TaxID=3413056 RepID=UPI003BF1A168